jgi:RNA polymerase-binding transcription factor DksA
MSDVEFPCIHRETTPVRIAPSQLISLVVVPALFMSVKRSKQPARRPRAATSDVLGKSGAAAKPPGRVPQKWKEYYRRLNETREFLLSRQNDLVKDACEEQPAFSLHMADAGTDSFDRDFALSRLSSEQDAVYEIDEALMRIRRGTYGVCELTGKPIEPARLEAIPWARFCAEAEKQLEKNGEIRRAHLAPRESIARTTNTDGESTDDDRFQ